MRCWRSACSSAIETREKHRCLVDVGTHDLPNYLGLDGFRFGWVAAWIDEGGDHGFDYSPGLTRLLAMPHARAMIDMPIGLNPSGYRVCDLRARELVGPAVFLGARRDLWTFPDMAAANRHYWEREGKGRGVSAQLWNIRDRSGTSTRS